jgi:4-hydroxybenzoate polyprenyltransferase
MGIFRSLKTTLEMIKWEHSIFALPFALSGAMLAANGLPRAWQALWIVACMVMARSAAMAFNRWVDAGFDAHNPRTRMRAIPAGTLSRQFVLGFTVCCSLLFIAAASQLNRLTLLLSPLALAIVFFYSLTKRFTRWSHLFLGLALCVSPTAAWIAVSGALDARILVLSLAVLFWVAGFDILYACQDVEFDREARLWSLPATAGVTRAFFYARSLHVVMILLLLWLVLLFHLGAIGWVGCGVVAALLLWEHSLVSPQDISRLNAAFFTMNGVISVLYFLFVAAALLLRW